MKLKTVLVGAMVAMILAVSAPPAALAESAICYNCPPQWADWASQLKEIKKNIGIDVPHDNKNSGQTLSQLIA